MKQRLYAILGVLGLLSITVLPMACTLVFEEEEAVPEEQKGYDKPAEVKTDTLNVTYQYQPSTRSITGKVLEYLVRVEADTILFFRDNTPIDYLPTVGGHVFADISEMLPYGLMHRVLSAHYEDGFFKVVCTPNDVKLRDVFTVFKLEASNTVRYDEVPYTVPDEDYDPEEELIPISEGEPDYIPTPVDFSKAVFDEDGALVNPEEARIMDNRFSYLTRAKGEAGDTTGTKTSDPDVSNWTFSLSSTDFEDISKAYAGYKNYQLYSYMLKCGKADRVLKLLKAGKGKYTLGGREVTLKSFNDDKGRGRWYWSLNIGRKNTETYYVNIEMDNFKYWVDDVTDYSVLFEMGYQWGLVPNSKRSFKVGDWLKKVGKLEKTAYETVLKPQKDPEFPIWGPVSLVIKPSLTFKAGANLCGQISYTYTKHKRTTIWYDKATKGIKKDVNEYPDEPKHHITFGASGNVEASLRAQLELGVRIGKAGINLDATVGGHITVGIKVGGNFDVETSSALSQKVSTKLFFNPYLKCGPVFKVTGEVLNMPVFDFNLPLPEYNIFNETYPLYPSVSVKDCSYRVKGEADSDFNFSDVDFELKYKFSSLGLYYTFNNQSFKPLLKVYEKATNKYVDTYEAVSIDRVKTTNQVYYFDLHGLNRDVLYKGVPMLQTNDEQYTYDDDAIYFTSANPSLLIDGEPHQTWGDYVDGLGMYKLFARLKLTGASKVASWGIDVEVRNSKSKLIGKKSLSYSSKKFNSKTYNTVLAVSAKEKYIYVHVTPWVQEFDINGKPATYKENNKDVPKKKYGMSEVVICRDDYVQTEQDVADEKSMDWLPFGANF